MIYKFIFRLLYKIVLLRLAVMVMRKLGVPRIFHPKGNGMAGRIATYGLHKRP